MNTVRKQRRRQPASTSPEDLADQLVREDPGPDAAFEHERLRSALERLPESEARLIRLRYYEELTFEAIGRRLDVPPSTAKAAFYRGMTHLEELLRPGSGEESR